MRPSPSYPIFIAAVALLAMGGEACSSPSPAAASVPYVSPTPLPTPPKPVTVVATRSHEAESTGLCETWSSAALDLSAFATPIPANPRSDSNPPILFVHGTSGGVGVAAVTTAATSATGTPTLSAAWVTPTGTKTTVELPMDDQAEVADVLAQPDGGWVVAWLGLDEASIPIASTLYLVRYDATGAPVARTTSVAGGGGVTLGADPGGGTDVAWLSQLQSGQPTDPGYGPLLVADVAPIMPSAPAAVTTVPAGEDTLPSVDGGYGSTTVEWEDERSGAYQAVWQGGVYYRVMQVTVGIDNQDSDQLHLRAWTPAGKMTLDTLVPYAGWASAGVAPDGLSGLLVAPGALTFEGTTSETVVDLDVLLNGSSVIGTTAGGVVAGIDSVASDGGGQPVVELFEVTNTSARSPLASTLLSPASDFAADWSNVALTLSGTVDDGTFVVVATGPQSVLGAVFTCTERWS